MNEPAQKNENAFVNPNTFFGVVCCLCLCATVAYIAYLSVVPHEQPPRRLWKPVIVETNGNETVLGESRQMEFWTPSAKTKDYLHMENGQVVPTETWEVISNDAAVEQFGTMLHSNQSVLGYRRVEVWGQGRTTFKPGWWWTVNALTNYTAGDLSQSYEQFWKSHQAVFVEVIDNRGNVSQ
jgi:hypothetical protein